MSYTLEILPYSLRAKGFNVFNFTISVALIFNQYVNPIALENIAWKYYVSAPSCLPFVSRLADAHRIQQIVYCVWLAFETVFLYFFIVETKNRTLEETAALFDGVDEIEKLHAATAKGEVRHEDYDEKASDAA